MNDVTCIDSGTDTFNTTKYFTLLHCLPCFFMHDAQVFRWYLPAVVCMFVRTPYISTHYTDENNNEHLKTTVVPNRNHIITCSN